VSIRSEHLTLIYTIYKNAVPTSQETLRLTLFREIIAVNCKQHHVWAKCRDSERYNTWYVQFRLWHEIGHIEAEYAVSPHWCCTLRRNNAVWSAMTSCQWPLHQRAVKCWRTSLQIQDCCCLYTNIASRSSRRLEMWHQRVKCGGG
jgi:hypothetical protein